MNMVTVLAAYLLLSFFLAALHVRQARRARSGTMVRLLRRKFYLFPLVPVLLPTLMIVRLIGSGLEMLFRFTRWMFEKISGKKTYHRKYDYYYYPGRTKE